MKRSVERGFESRSGDTKDYKIMYFVASPLRTQHTTLRERAKTGWLKSQDNVSEWGDMSILGLLFQLASTIKFQLSVLV